MTASQHAPKHAAPEQIHSISTPERHLFAVDSTGEAEISTLSKARAGTAVILERAAANLERNNRSHWFFELFETEEQRQERQLALIGAGFLAFVASLLGR